MEYLREWSARDRGLAEGLLAYEDSIGPHGIPWRVALDDEDGSWLEVEEITDHAQAAIDRWHLEHKGKDSDPGTRLVVVDTRPKKG